MNFAKNQTSSYSEYICIRFDLLFERKNKLNHNFVDDCTTIMKKANRYEPMSFHQITCPPYVCFRLILIICS
jgi:hypothetical protein